MDALELESAKQSPAVETAKDLFSGAVGGIAQVLIGMFILSSTQM
jgi:solute carrier family 25 carnitine/acylcarnitine transporter 20/29